MFFRASKGKAEEVKRVLSKYEEASGQCVNYQKSGLFFSSNTVKDKKMEVRTVLAVQEGNREGHYLGMPIWFGRKKKAIFRYVKDKVWQRIQGWNKCFLSRVWKEILLKTVA